jgi:hypothetical protein
MKSNRVIIYAKDIQRLTGRSERYARKLLAKMRVYFDKKPKQFVSVEEFCKYTGLKCEEVKAMLD